MGAYTTRPIEDSEFKEMIQTVRDGYTYNSHEHRPNPQVAFILELESNLGCRIGDIVNLRKSSFVCFNGIWRLDIIEEKTKKKRTFVVSPRVMEYINQYMEDNGIEDRLFTVGKAAVHKVIRQVCEYKGWSNISTHSLRKRFATKLYEASGKDIMAVSQILQHSSTKITEAYILRSPAKIESLLTNCVDLV